MRTKFLRGREFMKEVSLDPVYMGDGKSYSFSLRLNDREDHQFYVNKTQRFVTRQCLRVSDINTNEPERTFQKIVGP